MRKAFILLVITVILLPSSLPGQEKVKGGFRECRVYRYEYENNGQNLKSKSLMVKNIYDENGNKIEWYSYNSDGTIECNSTYKYDDTGNLIEEIYNNIDENFNHKIIYKYGINGKKQELEYFDLNGFLKSKEIYKYDKLGNMVESMHHNYDTSKETEEFPWVKETFKYNKYNKLIEKNFHTTDKSLDRREIYKYDKNGILIELLFYNCCYYLHEKHLIFYEQNSTKSEELIIYGNKGTLKEKFLYKYDDIGNKTVQRYFIEDNNIDLINTVKYDVMDNTLENVNYNKDGKERDKSIFKYDDFGNILEIEYFQQNKPTSKTEYIYSK